MAIDIDIVKIVTDITKYGITILGALMLLEAATDIRPVKFKMDRLHEVMVGSPLLSTGIVMIALTRGK